jgi:hypothetical protein
MEGGFPRAFERRDKFLYLGEFLYGIREICKKKRPCKRAALSIGPCWEIWSGSFTGTFERKRGCISELLLREARGH